MNTILFCGFATALGWGLRGEFGGPMGAMIPGAMLGLAIALTSCREDWLRKALVFGMAGTLGMAIGGNMSYGRVIGFSKGNDFVNVAYGYTMLGLIGALWGAFAAGALGIVASPKKYRLWQVVTFVILAHYTGKFTYWLLISFIGLSMNNDPARGEFWASLIGINLALLAFALIKGDPIPRRLMAWGLTAGAFGFTIGEAFQVIGSDLGPPYDWWKVMEQTFGFILGAGIAYGIRRECAGLPRTPPTPLWLAAFSTAVVLWLVPVITALDVVEHFQQNNLLRNAEAAALFESHFRLMAWTILFLLLTVVMWRGYAGTISIDSRTRAMHAFLWVLWACTLLGAVKKAVPAWNEHSLWVHQGFLAIAAFLTLWSTLDFHHDAGWWVQRRSLPKALAKLTLVYALAVIVIATTSIVTHRGEWRGDARIRFEQYAQPDAILD